MVARPLPVTNTPMFEVSWILVATNRVVPSSPAPPPGRRLLEMSHPSTVPLAFSEPHTPLPCTSLIVHSRKRHPFRRARSHRTYRSSRDDTAAPYRWRHRSRRSRHPRRSSPDSRSSRARHPPEQTPRPATPTQSRNRRAGAAPPRHQRSPAFVPCRRTSPERVAVSVAISTPPPLPKPTKHYPDHRER